MMPADHHAFYYGQPAMPAHGHGHPMHMSADGRGAYAHGGRPQAQPVAAQQQLWPLRMRGLPFDATELDVAEFFYPLPIAPYGISIQYHPAPSPTAAPRAKGEAYVAFGSDEVRSLALDRHKQLMRTRYIELFETSESDFLRSLQPAEPVMPQQMRGGGGGGGGYGPMGGMPMGGVAPMAMQPQFGQMGAPMRYAHPQQHGPYGFAQQHGGQYGQQQAAGAQAAFAQAGGQQPHFLGGAGTQAAYGSASQQPMAHHLGQQQQFAQQHGLQPPAGAGMGACGKPHMAGGYSAQCGAAGAQHAAGAAYGQPPAEQHAAAGYLGEMDAQLQQQQVQMQQQQQQWAQPPQQMQPQHPYGAGPYAANAACAYGQPPQRAGGMPAVGGAGGMGGVGVVGGQGCLYVRMRGLPFSAGEADILRFFAPLRPAPNGVLLGRNASGQPSGEAHVLFTSEADARTALLRNRHLIGQRYVELFLVASPDAPRTRGGQAGAHANGGAHAAHPVMQMGGMAAAGMVPMAAGMPMAGAGMPMAGGGAQPQLTNASIKLRGMPYGATADDVANFFAGYGVLRDAISLGPQPGQASVRFVSLPEASRALAEKNRQHMGNRYIELFAQ